MRVTLTSESVPNAAVVMPPPLHEGDRLDSAEFLQRWSSMPELKRAELIDGVVYCMPSPVTLVHGNIQRDVTFWLALYMDATPGCQSGLESTWVMGPDSVPQPDAFLRILPEHGGQSAEAGEYGSGAPELIVEVSASTLSRDLGPKLDLYRRSGVREYISVIPPTRQVVWRQLTRGRYREIAVGPDGLYRSAVFPGLWLDPEVFGSRRKSIRTALERGLKSPEHAAFVKRLGSSRRTRV